MSSRGVSLVVCVDCAASGPLHAKGRCARCYARARVQVIDCRDCGRRGPEQRGGRCARCYRLARTVEAVCLGCGELRRCWAGVCQRCKQRRRATAGACTSCGRQVERLWSGRRCAGCAHAGWTVGGCVDCFAWSVSIAGRPARCRACRDFARRNKVGACRSCSRSLPVNRAGRCRLCTAARRDTARLGGPPAGAGEPAQTGIQLFIGDLEIGPRPTAKTPAKSHDDDGGNHVDARGGEVDGQLELVSVLPEPGREDRAAQAWTRSPDGQAALGELAAFAAAHGWRPATQQMVADALALHAVTEPSGPVSAEVSAQCRRRRLPVSRLREFLASGHDPDRQRARTGADPAAPRGLPVDLPAAMTRELTTWVSVLCGSLGRSRPHAETTVAAYQRAVVPAVADWASRYASLREVTAGDVADALEPLTGSARTVTAVALRSLFAALKSQRMIFTDPARRIRPGRFPARPVLGLDDDTRAGLLANTDRADHRLVLLLAGVHALSRAEMAGLRIEHVDLAARCLRTRGRRVDLDELTYRQLRGWLEERRTRWPHTANPHLLVTAKSAYGVAPVSTRYFRSLPAALPAARRPAAHRRARLGRRPAHPGPALQRQRRHRRALLHRAGPTGPARRPEHRHRHTSERLQPFHKPTPAITAGMYLRTIQRRNKDGSVVRYVQLAHNVRDHESGNSIAHTVHSFGREDQLDRAALQRLAESIHCYLRDTDDI